jgi:gliding motility-associated-like protein
LKKHYKYCILLAVSMVCIMSSMAQGGYGQAVFKQDFGRGNADPATIGTPLPPAKTSFVFSNTVCPPAGSYTILRSIYPRHPCYSNTMIGLSHDYDVFVDYGMMMVVNNSSTDNSKLVYADTVKNTLCPGAFYRFSVAIINTDLINGPVQCVNGPDYPLFELRLEDQAGRLIKKDTTPPIVSYPEPPFFGYKFYDLGFNFNMPAGVTKLVLKLSLLPTRGMCAEDFAVDDIQIRPLGPNMAILFNNEPATTITKSVCFQDNKTVSMSGNMGPYYPNPALQWQQSTNNGATWSDIPGATAAIYSSVFSTPDTFLFRLSGSDASTISNPNCRVVSNTIKVEVDGLPSNYTITNNSPVCSGQDLQFKGEGAASYIWTGPNGFYDNIPSPHIFFSSLKDSGTYYVAIFSLGGCRVTDSTRVTIIGTDVYAGPDTAICMGNAIRLKATTGISYRWSPATGLSNTTSSSPRASPTVSTVYTVKVTDNHGCSDTALVEVKVINKREVKAIIKGSEWLCRTFDTASFVSQSRGDISKWHWNFGNGNTATSEKPPVQRYQVANNTNEYNVMLAVADTTGCADTAFHVVKVADNCYIAVPTAFTPNNDGSNDFLSPLNAYKAINLLFRVYNRRGRIVFQTKDWARKWDGRWGGVEQPSGTYLWTLEYNDMAGKKIALKGTTILIR